MGLRPLACWECGFESRRGQDVYPCECCVLSGRCLCVGLITQPEESYRMLFIYDREASINRRPCPTRSCCAIKTVSGLTCWRDSTKGPFSLPLLTVGRIGTEKGWCVKWISLSFCELGRSFFCWFLPFEGRKDWLFFFWNCFIHLWGRLLTF
jgi:hypothetical protein